MHPEQWQQPHQRQPYYPPQSPAYPPAQRPRKRVMKSVEKRRGLGGLAHSTHLMLTLFTCGAWLFVWIPWWIIRVIIPKRKVTKHYYYE